MSPKNYLALLCVAWAAAGCARVGIPPGRERVEDDEPPRLKKVKPVDANHVDLYFSEPMDPTTLRDAENYAVVDEAGEPLAVEDAAVARADVVTLVTARQVAGRRYRLVARNVADAGGGNRIERDNEKSFKGSGRDDEKPPAVTATFPSDGAEQVGLYPEILVDFTDVMAPAATATVDLFDDLGKAVPGEGHFDGHRFRFRAAARLDYGTRYTAVVNDTCADLAGNILYREQRFAFTTIEDTEEVIIAGRVRVLEEAVSAAGVEVRVTLSPKAAAPAAKVVAYAAADAEGNFLIGGVPPNSDAQASYYLVATVDEDDDGVADFIGGYNFAAGKAGALPTFTGGERLENVEVTLARADATGPVVEDARFSPDPTAAQDSCYIWAAFADAEGSPVTAAEVFFDDVWSDGTGIPLKPLAGEWGVSPHLAADRFIFDLRRRGIAQKGRHVAYIHARDAAGNWGAFREVAFEVSGAPHPSRKLAGVVMFEKMPAAGALVTVTPSGGGPPLASALTGDDGEFRLEHLAPGEYVLSARLDEDGDGRWRPEEPSATAPAPVDLTSGDARGLSVVLTYGPALTAANARLQTYAAGAAGEPRAVLTISAAAVDRDLDLERVAAALPDGTEVALADDGVPPDDAAGDGVFTFRRVWRGEEAAAAPAGEVKVFAVDRQGNRTEVTAAEYPGLRVVKLTPPPALELRAGADAVEVSWEAVPAAAGGYVVFLVPADRLARFRKPGTGEVYSNFGRPTFGNSYTVPFAAAADWWAYPAGSSFTVMLVASAGDARAFADCDQAVVSASFVKVAAASGAGGE